MQMSYAIWFRLDEVRPVVVSYGIAMESRWCVEGSKFPKQDLEFITSVNKCLSLYLEYPTYTGTFTLFTSSSQNSHHLIEFPQTRKM